MITFFVILINCLLDIVKILLGEGLSWSFIGVQGLKKKVSSISLIVKTVNKM